MGPVDLKKWILLPSIDAKRFMIYFVTNDGSSWVANSISEFRRVLSAISGGPASFGIWNMRCNLGNWGVSTNSLPSLNDTCCTPIDGKTGTLTDVIWHVSLQSITLQCWRLVLLTIAIPTEIREVVTGLLLLLLPDTGWPKKKTGPKLPMRVIS